MQNKPDFLYIGYPRTGSSWLFRQLIKHNQIFLPYCKEVDYYWGYEPDPKGNPDYIRQRLRRYRNERIQHYRVDLKKLLNWKRLLWDLRYLYGGFSQSWYHALFRKDQICGDVTPNLAFLTRREVARLYEALPNIKVILAFREPIDQLWSMVKQEIYLKFENLDSIPDSVLQSEVSRAVGSFPKYHDCYDTWASVIPKEQMYFYFFENAMADPTAHYTKICDFIGIEAELANISVAAVGSMTKPYLTSAYENLLIEEFRESVEILHNDDRFELPPNWYLRYPNLLHH